MFPSHRMLSEWCSLPPLPPRLMGLLKACFLLVDSSSNLHCITHTIPDFYHEYGSRTAEGSSSSAQSSRIKKKVRRELKCNLHTRTADLILQPRQLRSSHPTITSILIRAGGVYQELHVISRTQPSSTHPPYVQRNPPAIWIEARYPRLHQDSPKTQQFSSRFIRSLAPRKRSSTPLNDM
jgi:hypothetical protein